MDELASVAGKAGGWTAIVKQKNALGVVNYRFTGRLGEITVESNYYGDYDEYTLSASLGETCLGKVLSRDNNIVMGVFLKIQNQHAEKIERLGAETREDLIKYARSLLENG